MQHAHLCVVKEKLFKLTDSDFRCASRLGGVTKPTKHAPPSPRIWVPVANFLQVLKIAFTCQNWEHDTSYTDNSYTDNLVYATTRIRDNLVYATTQHSSSQALLSSCLEKSKLIDKNAIHSGNYRRGWWWGMGWANNLSFFHIIEMLLKAVYI